MIDDQIRKYVRAEIEEDDHIEASITRIASNLRDAPVNPIPITPLNISAKGLKFYAKYRFTTGIIVDLRIKLEDKIVLTSGKITRMEEIEDGHVYAVSFNVIKEYNSIIISSFVKRKTIDHIQRLRGES